MSSWSEQDLKKWSEQDLEKFDRPLKEYRRIAGQMLYTAIEVEQAMESIIAASLFDNIDGVSRDLFEDLFFERAQLGAEAKRRAVRELTRDVPEEEHVLPLLKGVLSVIQLRNKIAHQLPVWTNLPVWTGGGHVSESRFRLGGGGVAASMSLLEFEELVDGYGSLARALREALKPVAARWRERSSITRSERSEWLLGFMQSASDLETPT